MYKRFKSFFKVLNVSEVLEGFKVLKILEDLEVL